ncbi:MAG: folate/biopterin family MFS transporter [Synechococcales cyanobacterium RU_4_20]|nr:folate/biopterin family MFS transporter [Synechococcales cyanobacterium RU_4_20]
MLLTPGGGDRWKQSLKGLCQDKLLFGNEPTPELMALLLVYFIQGILGLSRLAVSFFLKDDLSLSPAQVSALMGIAAIPWMIKPLFGFISDGLPIFGYRRRPYIVLSGFLGMASWLALGTVIDSTLEATIAIGMSSLSVAISDVIADSIIVERARHESRDRAGSLQSLSWGVAALGGLISAYLGGAAAPNLDTRSLFLITAVFPLLVSAGAWLIAEEPTTDPPGFGEVRQQLGQLKIAITQRAIWMPTLFLFLWQCTPGSEAAFFFFTTNELGFQPEFLGRVRLVSSLAMLIGVWVFQRFLKNVPFRSIFGWAIAASSSLGLTSLLLVTHANRNLGISDEWFSLGDSLVLVIAGQIAFMPVLILAARLCPPGIEATFFALLMSIVNFGGTISSELGALLTHALHVTEVDFENLWLLVLITNLSTLLPLPLLGLVPNVNAQGLNVQGLNTQGLNTQDAKDDADLEPRVLAPTHPQQSRRNCTIRP